MSADKPIDGDKVAGSRQDLDRELAEHTESDLITHFVENVDDYAVTILDRKGIIATWNKGAELLYGHTAKEIVGRHYSDLFSREDIDANRPDELLAVVRDKGRYELEEWRVRKNGSRFWANVVTTSLRDDAGKVIGYGTVVRDFTDRWRVESALRTSEERFRLMVHAVKDYAIFMLDPTGHIISWNEGAQRMKGYTTEDILGRHFSIFYTPEDIARHHPAAELEIATREGKYEEEGWRVRKDGTRFWASVLITAVRDEQGVLRGFAKVTRDMTERRRAVEAQMQQVRDQISRAFLRDVLFSVTEGRLRFCESLDDLPVGLTPCGPIRPFGYDNLGDVRAAVIQAAAENGFDEPRIHDLVTAVGEASMNAIVHARTPTYKVCTDGSVIQVWIQDCGTGIEISHLHRATLERGFTTENSLGHGFWLMLHTCDRVWLLSTSDGTTVVIEQGRDVPEPEWMKRPREGGEANKRGG